MPASHGIALLKKKKKNPKPSKTVTTPLPQDPSAHTHNLYYSNAMAMSLDISAVLKILLFRDKFPIEILV